MIEYCPTRNAEGYIDPTPYAAMIRAPKPGEIWSYKDAFEVLILRNQGTFCNVLALVESSKDTQSIQVMSKSMRFTNPAMVRYCFNTELGYCIKKIPDVDFDAILGAVCDAMGFTPTGDIRAKSGESAHELIPKANPEEAKALKTQLIIERRATERAKAKCDMLQGMYDALLDRIMPKGADD